MKPAVACVVALSAAISLTTSVVAQSGSTVPRPLVLVIFSEDYLTPGAADLFDSVRAALNDPARAVVEIRTEYLNVERFEGQRDGTSVAEWLQRRFQSTPVRLVLCVGAPACTFVATNGATVWPGAAYVFSNVSSSWLSSTIRPRQSTAITVDFKYLETARAALAALPGTRELVLIAGATPTDREWLARARADLAPLEAIVTIRALVGLRFGELVAQLETMRSHSILVPVMIRQDGDGRAFVARELWRDLAPAASRPMFTVHAPHIGIGVVGGYMLDYAALGRRTAGTMRRILDGEPPERIPATASTDFAWQFDARQLQRWGISESALPSSARISFKDVPPWTQYRWWILGIAAVLLAQSAAIAALAYERRRRHRAELQNRDNTLAMAHLDRRAALGEMTSAITHELNQPLEAILHNTEAAEMMLDSESTSRDELRTILGDIRRIDLRAGQVVQRMRTLLRKHELETGPIEINELARDTAALVAPVAAAKRIVIHLDLADGTDSIAGDRVHLQQVLLNIMLNGIEAMDAMPQSERELVVSTVQANQKITIMIRDRGQGIAVGAASSIFEPFYTTKGQGMGLGLSIARTIVEAHGGSISARNNDGEGATVSVTLPTSATTRPVNPIGVAS